MVPAVVGTRCLRSHSSAAPSPRGSCSPPQLHHHLEESSSSSLRQWFRLWIGVSVRYPELCLFVCFLSKGFSRERVMVPVESGGARAWRGTRRREAAAAG
jgi:hypothetical protein